jgi:DNA-binding NarL/FixJ family response regulator
LRRAHLELESCGADGHRDRAARLLREHGVKVRRPGVPRGGALSEREEQVARLVADGLTNRQIAGELHLSTKTVEMHLTRAYAKLGIRRRAALARMITSAGGGT